MNIDLTAKTALVTGAAEGIGLAIANQLKASGARVMINDLDEDKLQAAAKKHQLDYVVADAAKMKGVEMMTEAVIDQYGQLDFLVANAGITRFASFLNATEADFNAVVDLNLKGTFFLAQAAARLMKAKGAGGSILLISSNISKRSYPGLSIYSATKAAINMLVKSMSLELSDYNIRVNALAPGPTLTERTATELESYAELWGEVLPTNDVVRPVDIAATANFLLSEGARQINGQTIMVDGGWSGLGVTPAA